MAPQRFLASGDGYARRFGEVISDVQRKTKCVDDTAMWDEDLKEHWWRMVDFLELLGKNGIVLNPEKFQFAQRSIQFAGFHISDSAIKPHEKFTKAIRDFPTPSRITDVRSWFGLVHQVSNYSQLTETMAPFKPLLSIKVKFFCRMNSWIKLSRHQKPRSSKPLVKGWRYLILAEELACDLIGLKPVLAFFCHKSIANVTPLTQDAAWMAGK